MSQLPDGAWPQLHDCSRWSARWPFRTLYRLRVHGRERIPAAGATVVVANHSAAVDGPLLYGLLGRRCVFLVKSEMFHGVTGFLLRRIGQLPVQRGEAARTSLLAAVHALRAGGVVGVFPEGSRGDGNVVTAHHGAAWLARASNAVVLPVAVRGTRRARPRRFRPRVDVLVGRPMAVATGGGRAGLTTATERIRSELGSLVSELDSIRAGGPTLSDPMEGPAGTGTR